MTHTAAPDVGSALTGRARQKWFKVVVDSMLLVGFVSEFITREGPDYAVHSWIGIVLVPTVAFHLLGNLGWIKRVWVRKRQDRDFGLGVLDAGLGALTGVCILTGFPIWLEWADSETWSGVHTATGLASMVIMFVHLWKNRTRLRRSITL